MATAMIKIPFQEDLLQQIDRFVERKAARSRVDLILAATEMYIQRKQNWQDLFSYGEQIASENNFSEDDVMNEIKASRNSK
jgi:metal-responsive CopG/Arc/MetJ family transcriptional regulator